MLSSACFVIADKVFDVVVFEGPDMLAEFGGVSVFGVAE